MIKTKEDYIKIEEKLRELVKDWGLGSIYMVGGCVRDEILGLLPKDIDLVIDYPNGSEIFVDFLDNKFSDICSGFTKYSRYGTSKFTLLYDVNSYIDIECVIPRSESYDNCFRKPNSVQFTTIEKDAMRRDFCCNALYKNVLTGEIIDPTGKGLEDIKNRVLRTPLEPRQTFRDDPLRMLRAIRFYCNKSFEIDGSIYSELKPIQEFYGLSMERIKDEFEKIIMSSKPIEGINLLYNYGFLEYIIPNFCICYGYDQNSKYHNLTLDEHTFRVLSGVMNIDEDYELELRWSALLHDIGKPVVAIKNNVTGYTSYYGHERKSSEMARIILGRLKYSNNFIDRVCIIIENHMCIKQLYNYETKEYTGKPSKTRKIALKLGDLLRPTMELIDSDNKAHAQEYCMDNQVELFWKDYNEYVSFSIKQEITNIITGNEIMTEFYLMPGKNVGDIKRIIQDLYLENPELTKEELIKFIKDETDNKEFWVTKLKHYQIGFSEPTLISNTGEFFFVWNIDDSVITLDDLDYDYFCLGEKEKIKVRAVDYINVYKRLKDYKKVESIMQKINNLAQDLLTVDSFQSIEISYDTSDSFNAKIYWKDGKITKYEP